MRKKYIPIILIPVVLLLPAAAEFNTQDACEPPSIYPESIESAYPAHEFSPKKALDTYDYVFTGEVLVPTRKCSLGYCAGLKILTKIKGKVDQKNLIRVAHSGSKCLPHKFAHKGVRWLIFASSGTTAKGTKYLQVESDGPSYPTQYAPNFDVLEQRYHGLQAQLDQVITDKLR